MKLTDHNYAANNLTTITHPSDTEIVSSELIDQLVDALYTANQKTMYNYDVYLTLAIKYHIINDLFKHDFERALTDRKKHWYQRNMALTEKQYMQLYTLLKELPPMTVIFNWITEKAGSSAETAKPDFRTSERFQLREKLRQRCQQSDLKDFTGNRHSINQYVDDLHRQLQQGHYANRPGDGSHYEPAVMALFKYCELIKEELTK